MLQQGTQTLGELRSRNNHVNHPVLQQEFGGLKAVGQFLTRHLLDHTWAGEANDRARLGDDDIGDGGVAGGDTAKAGISEQRQMR